MILSGWLFPLCSLWFSFVPFVVNSSVLCVVVGRSTIIGQCQLVHFHFPCRYSSDHLWYLGSLLLN